MRRRRPIELAGASVAVTGGARGIGRAAAALFVARGARVAIGDLDAAAAAATAAALGPQVRALSLDVRSRESFAAFLAAAESACGPLDVLVNNAGIMPIGRFLEQDDAVDRTTLDVNTWGPLLGMRLAAPGMVARGSGHIVNVASMLGKIHVPGLAGYVASKHATVGLSLTVRAELARTGVTTTVVTPTAVRTELASGVTLGAGLPAVDPDQVAEAIVASCRHRRGEVAVPRWLGLASPLHQLVPERLRDVARRAIRDDRGLTTLDAAARATYVERVAAQVAGTADEPVPPRDPVA